MLNITDTMLGAGTLFFFYRGWQKGFLRTLIGPIALMTGTTASVIYFAQTKNIPISLLIGLIGPIILALAMGFLINASAGQDQKISSPSRFLAGIFNVLWGETMIILVIVLIAIVPFEIQGLTGVQRDIHQSQTFRFLNFFVKTAVPQPSSPVEALRAYTDPKRMEGLRETPEFQSLAEDPELQALIANPEITELIQKGDLARLMVHPQIIKLLENPELLKKIMALQGKMLKEGSPAK